MHCKLLRKAFCLGCLLLAPAIGYGDIQRNSIEVLAVEYPPFTSESDPTKGIAFLYLSEFAANELLSSVFEPVFVPPARAESLLSLSKYCMAFYPPRTNQDLFAFQPLSEQRVALGLIRKRKEGDFVWNSLSELSGRSVAILRSNIKSPLLIELESNGMELVYVESISQGLRMLEMGRVDYAFGDKLSLAHHGKVSGINAAALQLSSTFLLEAQIGFHYKKDCVDQIFRK